MLKQHSIWGRLKTARHPKLRYFFLFIVALLVGFRVYLPTLVTNFVNKKLNEIPGYEGHIDGVHIHLWRGAYTILQPALIKEDGKIKRPFIEAKDIDLSVNWAALFHGALVAKFEFDELRVNVVSGPTKDTSQKGIDLSALDKLRDLFPLRIDKVVINDGELHYTDPWGKPPFDIYLDDIQAVARNLTNSDKISKSLVATLAMKGRAMHSGHFKVDASIDPYAKKPTFDVIFELKELNLKELNGFIKDALAVEVTDGTLGVWAEASVKEGQVHGYVKPLIKSLEAVYIKRDASLVETLKGIGVQIATAVFRNRPHEQIGAKVDFNGSLDKPDISIWDTIISVLSNAFVQALEPKLEGNVAKNAEQDNKAINNKDDQKAAETQQKAKEEVNKKVARSNKGEKNSKRLSR